MTVASLLLLATLAALTVSLGARWRRREPDAGPDAALEGLVIQGALGLGLVGLAATGLAIAGVFSAMTLAGVCAILAATLWPWRLTAANAESAAPSDPRVGWTLPAGLVVVLLGLAVRAPLHPADLAGRDQGTYVLRAQHTLRTGAITYVDPVLAQASHDAAARARPGPADLLGLYPTPHDGWRADLYEAPYRPGFYLADRETGTVVPQFLHLHPMLLAVSGALFGARGLTWVMYWEAALTLLGCWAVTRRIWARRPIWALLATSLYALAPLAIWVQRTPLSEGLVGMLLMAAALALVRAPAGDDDDPRATWATLRCAALLGLTAWARGNLWMALPVVLLILFLQTGRGRARRASALLVALAIASLITHACTSFPYLHDEFRRQLALADGLPPARMIRAALACAVAWLALDGLVAPRLWRRPRLLRARAAIVRALPTLYLALCLAALALYVWGRAGATRARRSAGWIRRCRCSGRSCSRSRASGSRARAWDGARAGRGSSCGGSRCSPCPRSRCCSTRGATSPTARSTTTGATSRPSCSRSPARSWPTRSRGCTRRCGGRRSRSRSRAGSLRPRPSSRSPSRAPRSSPSRPRACRSSPAPTRS
ncbi:MAG: hypothetical protein H6713_37635 [Myxococcales bacterium]|nr:hypothetical protein [Myxococcales bacterium]